MSFLADASASTRLHRVSVCLLVVLLLFSGCYRKLCPAYASAFILDDSVRRVIFSLFGEDSMPLPPPPVKKDKNGLIVKVSDRKKRKQMRIILAKKVYPLPSPTTEEVAVEASSLFAGTDTLLSQTDTLFSREDLPTADSTVVDSATASPMYRYGYDPKDNFNVEQDFYNKHFGHLFIAEEGEAASDTAQLKAKDEFKDIPTAYDPATFQEEEDSEEEIKSFLPERTTEESPEDER